MSTQQHHPPKWAHRFLEWYCTPALLEDLEGDLHEYFNRNVEAKGLRKAQLIYIVDVIKFIRLYTIKKPQPYYAMNKFIMYQNYYKASIRNIKRNKLFSFINIVGLAISMSVGVLLITLLAELKSYDKFHKHVERIYRVNNLYEQTNEGKELYASTSILAGKKIKESISGIDDVTIVRGSFDKDVTVGDKVIPLEGLWADDRFLSVFSFDVIAGNPQTALRDLYSVVLTESSANKVFGTTEVVGKQVGIDTLTYTVQAVIQDPPFNSHLRFEMLGSLVTLDTRMLADNNHNWMSWRQMWQNYVYVLLPEHQNPERIETSLSRISAEENKKIEHESIELRLQPLTKIVLGEKMSNQIGPNLDRSLIWILTGLAFVVIISACFNYTNLSIARALRRTREVGIRKVVGATRRQVFSQFMVEAVLISLFSMLLSYPIFALIRPEFIAMDISLQRLVSLQPEGSMYLFFIVLAVFVGLVAGFLPALFFSRMNSIQVLKDIKNVKLFRHLNFRKP